MNREHYDPKILSTFNIIGSYFVDYYYNQLYHSSRRIHEKHVRSSLTDEYKRAVQIFYEECNRNKKQYTLVITRLHDYYKSTTRFSTILLQDFTNKILSHFLPDEHYSVMNAQEKSYFLQKILISIIRDFTMYVSQIDVLTQVIDDHSNRDNIQRWVNQIVDIQIRVRENLWHNFISQGKAQTVNIDLFNRMQDDRNKLWDVLNEKVVEIERLKQDLANARKIVEHYSLENARLSDEIARVSNGAAVVRSPPPPTNSIQRGARNTDERSSVRGSDDRPARNTDERSGKSPRVEKPSKPDSESEESEPSDTDESDNSGSESETTRRSSRSARKTPVRRGSTPKSAAKNTPNKRRERDTAKPPAGEPVQTSSGGDLLIDFTESTTPANNNDDPFATPV